MTAQDERYAFLSVLDTTGIVDFGRGLVECGFTIVATPGTAHLLRSAGLEVLPVEEVTDFPVILDGMVKSLHPRILAGLMVDQNDPAAMEECRRHGIPVFEVAAINSPGYDTMNGEFAPHRPLEVAPLTVIRAAAANYEQVLLVTRPHDYPEALAALRSADGPAPELRRRLAREAWQLGIHHDLMATRRFEDDPPDPLPPVLQKEYRRVEKLRYGENPHQMAALYAAPLLPGPCVAGSRLLAGTPLSYNNIVDADVGLSLALEFAAPGTVIVKHAMPVSAAIGTTIAESAEKAFAAEWAGRVGAAVAVNGTVDGAAAAAIAQPGRSLDLVIASEFTAEAVYALRHTEGVSGERRLLRAGDLTCPAGIGKHRRVAIHHVTGGVLAQTVDDGVYGSGGFHVMTRREPTDEELVDLEFACLVAKHTRSHATVLAHAGATIAVATVQTSRAEASHIALDRAGNRAPGTVMASDGAVNLAEVAMLAEAGIRAIIHSGGSPEEDEPLIQACNQKDVAMIVTRMRHYSHI
jgi:phosphoribosylaminoimidazolecarboxamide formyltransferase/IMP cyclohydrolase